MEDTTKLIFLLLLVFPFSSEATHDVTGTPPSFDQEPQDMLLFERDAAGNRVSLTLHCVALGDPRPTITWYRGGTLLSNNQVSANGSLHIAEITENTDATRGGLSYHCTASNTFGTIRSRTAIVSYAYFDGFSGQSGTVQVNVATGSQADVAIECRVRDANPPPQIRWRDRNGVLTEDTTNNRLRFLDNGRYLLIRQLTTAQINTNYQCEVTNARLHETVRSPTTYDLVDNVGTNDFMTYKSLISRTILVGSTVEISYIAGAGSGVNPFGIIGNCRRSGSTLSTPILLPVTGGVTSTSIPDTSNNEQIPATANSVTFQVNCTLAAGTNPFIASQATITVQAPPRITMSPSNDFEKLVGERVSFTCVVEGIPTPTVTWYHNGVQLSAGGVISISGNTLNISSLTVGHTGMYQCFASNVVGSTQHSWALQVRMLALPVVTATSFDDLGTNRDVGKPVLVAASSGRSVVVFAIVTADPCPTVQWRLNGTNIRASDVYSIYDPCSATPAGGTAYYFSLTITTTTETAGIYNGILSNSAGTTSIPDVFVTPPVPVVVSDLQLASSPPCLLNGTAVDIRCVVSGFPRPNVFFYKGTDQIFPSVAPFNNFKSVDGENDTIRLTVTQQADSGVYLCKAKSGDDVVGQNASKSLMFCRLPAIVDLPAPVNHTEGTRFVLVCTFTGVPTPNVRWEKDGSVFLLGGGRSIVNSTGRSQLVINSLALSDAGVYTCSVTNMAGTATNSVRLEVEEGTSISPTTSATQPGSGGLPLTWIIVGGVGGGVVVIGILVLLCGVIIAACTCCSSEPYAAV